MSVPPNVELVPPPQDKPAEVKCMKCGVGFTVTVPQPKIDNQIEYSLVVVLHEKPLACPSCGQLHTFMLPGRVNYQLAVVPIAPAQLAQQAGPSADAGRIIIPPAGAFRRKN